jgi:hypothetical protein
MANITVVMKRASKKTGCSTLAAASEVMAALRNVRVDGRSSRCT